MSINKKKQSSKFVLGTAQFGGGYGPRKNNEIVTNSEFNKIVGFVKKKKINFLDTARSYGSCEKRLSFKNLKKFNVITKILVPHNSIKKPEIWIRSQIKEILKNLNLKKIYGVLFHNSNFFVNKKKSKYFIALKKLKKEGLVKKIGFSVYEPKELKYLMKYYSMDIVQLPYSIADRRFDEQNCFKLLKEQNIEIYVRSIFLQGLLLYNYNSIPKKFKKYENKWKSWRIWLKKNNISPIDACLNFVMLNKNIDKIVVGVHNLKQLKQIASFKKKKIIYPKFFPIKNKKIIDPRTWKVI